MRRVVSACLIFTLFLTQAIAAPRNSWYKIRYRGGTVVAKVDSWDFNTALTVKTDEIIVVIGTHAPLRMKPAEVDSISYGQEAHKRVGDIVALSLVLGPLALFGLLGHPKDQLVGIVYHEDDGKRGAILLETPQALLILRALAAATGKKVDFTP